MSPEVWESTVIRVAVVWQIRRRSALRDRNRGGNTNEIEVGKTFGEGELEETGAFGEGVREDKQRRAVMATVERDYQSSKVVVASMEAGFGERCAEEASALKLPEVTANTLKINIKKRS